MCGHRQRNHRFAKTWPDDVRASDADRDATVASLRDHAASGRLDADELDERLEVALRATTLGELRALVGDLPGATPRFGPSSDAPRWHDARAHTFARAWWVVPLGVWGIASAFGAH